MAKIWLDSSDGRYSIMRQYSDEEAAKLEAEGHDVYHVEDTLLDAYYRHLDQDAVWQALWRSMANEKYVQRRARELLPLEDAAREIDRLKEELARAQRTARYFEDEWARERGLDPREEPVVDPREEPSVDQNYLFLDCCADGGGEGTIKATADGDGTFYLYVGDYHSPTRVSADLAAKLAAFLKSHLPKIKEHES
jgi:hypothetical protein